MSDLLTDVLAAIRAHVVAYNATRTDRHDHLLEGLAPSERGIAMWSKTKYPAAYLELVGAINPNALELHASFRKSHEEDYEVVPPVTVTRLMTSGRPKPYVRDGDRYETAADVIAGPVSEFLARVNE